MTKERVAELEAQVAELQASQNGNTPTKWAEIGTTGLEAFYGFVEEAYTSELTWPTCWPLYSRIWRSDPEVTIARMTFGALARQYETDWELPEKPNDDDIRVKDFGD